MLCLDIGPGSQPIRDPKPEETWHTADLYKGYKPTILVDFTKIKTKIADGTYDYIHASHVIEHVEWHQVQQVMQDWVDILKPGGKIEVWTVNAITCFDKLYEYEATGQIEKGVSTWRHKLTGGDPYLYWVGKLLNYVKAGSNETLNLHRSIFVPTYLRDVLIRAGLENVHEMTLDETRGHKHGLINMGFRGFKPKG